MNTDEALGFNAEDWHRQVLDAAPDAMVVVAVDEKIV